MKISVFGTGYVGLVTGVCFAEMGNNVTCVDIDKVKVDKLTEGISPIYEPGLEDLLKSNIKNKRIKFTTNSKEAIAGADILFIAVGTPSAEDGSADLTYVLSVAKTIAEEMNSYKLIVTKSTVPIGTHKKIADVLEKTLATRGVQLQYDVVSNPEFLREGCAIEDCLRPNRVVIGVSSDKAAEMLSDLYVPFLKDGSPLIVMDQYSSEMTKYAANAMLAAKISIMNEFSRICEKTGADIEAVRKGIGSDHRIGPHFIYAGVGYGGSCFPKDVSALIHFGNSVGVKTEIMNAVESTNKTQREIFYEKIISDLGKNLSNRVIGIWGVAFKPGTDDIREAPALNVIQNLIDAGASVRVYDPIAKNNALEYFNHNPKIKFMDDQYEVLEGADALCLLTEWPSFREPDFDRMKKTLRTPKVFDGRNVYSTKTMKKLGFSYRCVGRPHE